MSSSYFENRDCEYYPCHNAEHMNCLFCFCPLYDREDCGGNCKFIETENGTVKDCSDCMYPHCEKNYDEIMQKLRGR